MRREVEVVALKLKNRLTSKGVAHALELLNPTRQLVSLVDLLHLFQMHLLQMHLLLRILHFLYKILQLVSLMNLLQLNLHLHLPLMIFLQLLIFRQLLHPIPVVLLLLLLCIR